MNRERSIVATYEAVAHRTLAEIASDIGEDLTTWPGRCHPIAVRVIQRYHLPRARLWAMGNRDPNSVQGYHAMILAPGGRVLDPMYRDAKYGDHPDTRPTAYPFWGTRRKWGRGRGFDARLGCEARVFPELHDDIMNRLRSEQWGHGWRDGSDDRRVLLRV
jgi:hypothetical protein